MPLEKRDSASKARLFIPTNRERSLVQSQRQLDKSLAEVEEMKKELQTMMNTMRKK
jgi:hypothetical protein